MIAVDIEQRLGTFDLEVAFSADAPIVGLFGRSGSGKTSVVNALAGTSRPRRGRIVINGETLFDSARGIDLPPEKRRLGYVFQDGLLFPHLDVESNLLYGLHRAPAAARVIDPAHVIQLLGLKSLLRRLPDKLSGGEKQRVAIGRALLAQPRLLLMDEPLASLDVPRQSEVLRYIEQLRDDLHIPIVYVSHAVGEITRLADTVVAAHDLSYGLTTLRFDGGELVVPNVEALVGERVRVRIRARDVSLALARPAGLSVLNVLPATLVAIATEEGPIVDVQLRVGQLPLTARITRRSAHELALREGQQVYALIKAVSLDRRSVGYA